MPRTAQDMRAECLDATDHIRGIVPSFFPEGGGASQPAHISPHPLDPYVSALGLQREPG